MTDFSKCPSCQAPGNELPNGCIGYDHGPGCRVGTLVSTPPVGSLGSPPPVLLQGRGTRYCRQCGAHHIPGDYPSQLAVEGSWRLERECPICWAVAVGSRL